MFDNLDDFKKKAIDNKANLKFKNISIPIGDGEQDFRITGIGEKAIKIEKYVKYEDIMDAVMDGKDEGLEAIIMEFIEDLNKSKNFLHNIYQNFNYYSLKEALLEQ